MIFNLRIIVFLSFVISVNWGILQKYINWHHGKVIKIVGPSYRIKRFCNALCVSVKKKCIGHMKNDGHLGRNYFKDKIEDTTNARLPAIVNN